MPTRSVVVGSRVGLHARPAALVADAVGRLGVRVTLATPGGDPVDAASALLIMTLGVGRGETVEVASDDAHALEVVAALVASELDA